MEPSMDLRKGAHFQMAPMTEEKTDCCSPKELMMVLRLARNSTTGLQMVLTTETSLAKERLKELMKERHCPMDGLMDSTKGSHCLMETQKVTTMEQYSPTGSSKALDLGSYSSTGYCLVTMTEPRCLTVQKTEQATENHLRTEPLTGFGMVRHYQREKSTARTTVTYFLMGKRMATKTAPSLRKENPKVKNLESCSPTAQRKAQNWARRSMMVPRTATHLD